MRVAVAAWSHTWSTATVVAVAVALSILADDVPVPDLAIIDALMLVALVLAPGASGLCGGPA